VVQTVAGSRALKRTVSALLKAPDFEKSLHELRRFPARQVVNPLFSFLLSSDEEVRWRAVTAMGAVLQDLASTDMGAARVIMRRLMWSLNDESGGIGWGAPEVMGEAMARHESLANEYASILTSYCYEEGNFLEYEALQRGLLWALIRLVRVRPALVRIDPGRLNIFLRSRDPVVRGLAAWATGLLGHHSARSQLESLRGDKTRIKLYLDRSLQETTVEELALTGLACLDQ